MPNIQKDGVYQAAVAPFVQYYSVLEENKNVIEKLKQELKAIVEKEENEDNKADDEMEIEDKEETKNKKTMGSARKRGDGGMGSSG